LKFFKKKKKKKIRKKMVNKWFLFALVDFLLLSRASSEIATHRIRQGIELTQPTHAQCNRLAVLNSNQLSH